MRSLVALIAIALAAASPVAADVAPEVFAGIDAKLRAAEWKAARELALEQLDAARGSLYAAYLGGVTARLAVAEAGLGRREDAIWHWQVAQNLDRAALPADFLASLGETGATLARQPLRQAGESPAGVVVYRTGGGSEAVQPARRVAGEPPQLSALVGQVPVPKALHVEVVIDAEGRLQAPVVIGSAAPGMIWEALEALRGWRYEPARKGSDAVAVLHDLRFNAPALRPLGELVELDEEAVEAEELLRAGKWEASAREARLAWLDALEEDKPRRELLAADLALRALAEAGKGSRQAAVCRWQAAQHLDERLYGMDLTPYGAAGVLLERYRWGMTGAATTTEGREAQVTKGRPVAGGGLPARAQGVALLVATVDEQGGLHRPLILGKRPFQTANESAAAFRYTAGPLDAEWLGALVALDAVCDWTFEPAQAAGRPLSSELMLAVTIGRVPARGMDAMRFYNDPRANGTSVIFRPTIAGPPHSSGRP